MPVTNYVTNTWLLANLFHPFLVALAALAMGYDAPDALLVLVLSGLVGLIASLPLLLLTYWALLFVVELRLSITRRYNLWLVVLSACFLLFGAVVAGIVTGWAFDPNQLVYLLPAFAAMQLAALLRMAAFERLCAGLTPPDTSEWHQLISQSTNNNQP